MNQGHKGVVKVIIVVVLAVLVGIAFLLMTKEQDARTAAGSVHDTLADIIGSDEPALTPEEVHERIGRQPHETRIPGKGRFVEEYRWKGPMSEHIVYAYYETAATKLLEGVSINQRIEHLENSPSE